MSDNNAEQKPRKRSLTELTLGWLAERLRKSDEIKEAVRQGTYSLDTKKVAESIVNEKS